MKLFILLCVVSAALAAVDHKQIRGIKRLIKNLNGVYPTCNLVLFKDQVDYTTAEARCQNFGLGMREDGQQGNLATVNDDEKNSDLKILLEMAYPIAEAGSSKWGPDRWVWAGMRKVQNNIGKAAKEPYSSDDWAWADGSNPDVFAQWMKKQPDQRVDKKTLKGTTYYQNQMRINHKGAWDDTYAYKTHPYACDYQGKYILSATELTWTSARDACVDAGLELAKVRSLAEVEEMKISAHYFLGSVSEDAKFWAAENWIWLGGNDINEEGVWEWIDGEEMVFPGKGDFRDPNPDNAEYIGEDGQDVLSISKWGEFDDSFHTKRKRPFACQCPGT